MSFMTVSYTHLTIASSGVLGTNGADGTPLQGIELTIAAFSSNIGVVGAYIVSIGISLFDQAKEAGVKWEPSFAGTDFSYLKEECEFDLIKNCLLYTSRCV